MSKRGDIEFLSDIKEAIKRIEEYAEKIDYDKFLKDKKTQDAVVRNLQIIGEAVNPVRERSSFTPLENSFLTGRAVCCLWWH